jgi:hypothetical protein
MKKLLTLFLAVTISTSILIPSRAQADVPAKAKAFLTVSGYGATGGALLGLASMAFGTSSRAIAQGASLGLYAGILFGTYVLVSHHQKRYGSYDDSSSPYTDSTDVYGDEYNSSEGGSDTRKNSRGGFFDRMEVMEHQLNNRAFSAQSDKRRGSALPPLKVNILSLEF